MQSCADTEWKIGIMNQCGILWFGHHGNGEEKFRVVEEVGYFQ